MWVVVYTWTKSNCIISCHLWKPSELVLPFFLPVLRLSSQSHTLPNFHSPNWPQTLPFLFYSPESTQACVHPQRQLLPPAWPLWPAPSLADHNVKHARWMDHPLTADRHQLMSCFCTRLKSQTNRRLLLLTHCTLLQINVFLCGESLERNW